jgi:hypothetical protein
MMVLWRLFLVFGCAEALLFLRWNMGIAMGVLLGVFITIKHWLLQYLLLSQSYIHLLHLGVMCAILNIVARIFLPQTPLAWLAPRLVFTPPWHSGNRFWRLIGLKEKWTLLYVEPAVFLAAAIFIAGTGCCGRFQPYWHYWGQKPMPRLPDWLAASWWHSLDAAMLVSTLLPAVTLLALLLHNRYEYAASDEGKNEALNRRGQVMQPAQVSQAEPAPSLTFPTVQPANKNTLRTPRLEDIRQRSRGKRSTVEGITTPKAEVSNERQPRIDRRTTAWPKHRG